MFVSNYYLYKFSFYNNQIPFFFFYYNLDENLGMICNDNEDDLEHPIEVFPRSFPRLLDGSEAYYSILKVIN